MHVRIGATSFHASRSLRSRSRGGSASYLGSQLLGLRTRYRVPSWRSLRKTKAEAILCSSRTRPSSIRSCQNLSLRSLTRSADVIPPSCTGDESGQSNTHSGLEEPKSKSATKHYCPPAGWPPPPEPYRRYRQAPL